MTNQFIISNPEVDLEEPSPSSRLTTSTAASPEPSSGVNFEWAKGIGGSGLDSGLSLAIDSEGNVYTTGSFQGTADFDPGAGTFNLTSAGETDIFISKLDSQGNFEWAKNFGGWWWIYFGWWWMVVGGAGWWWVELDGGGWWHSLV